MNNRIIKKKPSNFLLIHNNIQYIIIYDDLLFT